MNGKKSKRGQRKKNQVRKLWPLLIAIGGIALIGLALWATRRGDATPDAVIEVQGAPSLKVDQEKIDLGDIRLGKTVSASFTLTNVGDKPLRLTDQPYIEVAAGC